MDPQSQQAANWMAGMGAGVFLFIILIAFAILAFFIYLFWRVFTKAGLSGPLSLLVLVPFGPIIVLCILAFSEWKVVPVNQYTGMTPYPPPGYPPAGPPSYPPSGYPPQGPTA